MPTERSLPPTFWVAVVMALSLLGTAALWWRHLDEEPRAGLLAAPCVLGTPQA